MNYWWHEIIEGAAHHYQSNFYTSKIVAQLSKHNDIWKNRLQRIEALLTTMSARQTWEQHQSMWTWRKQCDNEHIIKKKKQEKKKNDRKSPQSADWLRIFTRNTMKTIEKTRIATDTMGSVKTMKKKRQNVKRRWSCKNRRDGLLNFARCELWQSKKKKQWKGKREKTRRPWKWKFGWSTKRQCC